MVELAGSTFNLLLDCVNKCIGDVRKEAFKLVTGKITESPFNEQALSDLRDGWANLLPDPTDAKVVDEGQPFFLRATWGFHFKEFKGILGKFREMLGNFRSF